MNLAPNKNSKMKGKSIVVIDDEVDVLEILSHNFGKERANIATFNSGQEGLSFISKNKPDAIICDWMLPDVDGLEICKILKNNQSSADIPFVMLTAKSDEIYAVLALEMGADDYLTKPIRIKELITRVKKMIKDSEKNKKPISNGNSHSMPKHVNQHYITEEIAAEPALLYNDFKINTEKYKAYINDTELNLTHSEFKLLHLFMKKPGRVFTRNQIIEKLCGLDYIVTERSIDVQVVGLRKKLGAHKECIETVRGVGYRLRE